MRISVLPGRLAVCRLRPEEPVPSWAVSGPLVSVTRTAQELSVVCGEEDVPAGVTCERGWRCLRVQGPLAFAEIGVLSSLAAPLAAARISVFVVSTYDTDHLLVKEDHLGVARAVLAEHGHAVEG